MNDFAIEAEPLLRVLSAIALGSIVGFEREANEQAAGLRTHISVALGACVFGIISTLGFEPYQEADPTRVGVDVSRVASQVVVGIGFIGAGVIFRHGATVRNLTTAASLWVTAAIGLAAGIGNIGLGIIATAALVIGLAVLRLPRRWIRRNITKTTHDIRVRLGPGTDPADIEQVMRSLPETELKALRAERQNSQVVLRATLEAGPRANLALVFNTLATRPDLVDVEVVFEREPTTD